MKRIIYILVFLFVLYSLVLVFVYFFQESFIFYPEKLDKEYKFEFKYPHKEIQLKTNDGFQLNALLFEKEKSKGLVFFLHGNAGSLRSWGYLSETFKEYDVFIMDYRGYGKSEGKTYSEAQFYKDTDLAYEYVLKLYDEKDIIVVGNSIGTAAATKIASENNPKLLVLQAPYYSFTELAKEKMSFLPRFITKYQFKTQIFITKCTMPVIIFHGEDDTLIPVSHAKRLEKHFKDKDKLIVLENQGHNGINQNELFMNYITNL